MEITSGGTGTQRNRASELAVEEDEDEDASTLACPNLSSVDATVRGHYLGVLDRPAVPVY
jgi:hypothetical protein